MQHLGSTTANIAVSSRRNKLMATIQIGSREQLLRHPKIGTDLTHQAMARDDSYVSVNVNLIALSMHFVRCNVHG